MKRAQMRSDMVNISAVVVEYFECWEQCHYTIFYTSGFKRSFHNPSVSFRSRFDYWHIRYDHSFDNVRFKLLVPRLLSVVPDSVYTYFPILAKEI